MSRQCEAVEVLAEGTKVRVQNRLGYVSGVKYADGPGQVSANVITFTHKIIHRSGCMANRIEPLSKHVTQGCNYAFITIQEAA